MVCISPLPDSNPQKYTLEFNALGMTHSGGSWPTLADAMHEAERICPAVQWDQ